MVLTGLCTSTGLGLASLRVSLNHVSYECFFLHRRTGMSRKKMTEFFLWYLHSHAWTTEWHAGSWLWQAALQWALLQAPSQHPFSSVLSLAVSDSQITGFWHTNRDAKKGPSAEAPEFFCFGLGAVEGWHKRLAQLIAKQQQMGYRAELKKPDHLCLWPSCGNVRPFQAYAECCLGSTWGKSGHVGKVNQLGWGIKIWNWSFLWLIYSYELGIPAAQQPIFPLGNVLIGRPDPTQKKWFSLQALHDETSVCRTWIYTDMDVVVC